MLRYILFVGTIGGLLFMLLLSFVALLGIGNAARDETGHFRKKWNWKAFCAMGFALLFFIGYPLWATNYWIHSQVETPSFGEIWLLAYGITMFINLWDLVVVDYLIIIWWHPSFLNLPNTVYYNKIKPHIQGFFKGILWCILFSTIITGVIFFLLP